MPTTRTTEKIKPAAVGRQPRRGAPLDAVRASSEDWSNLFGKPWIVGDLGEAPAVPEEGRDLFGTFRCKYRVSDHLGLSTIPDFEVGNQVQSGMVLGPGGTVGVSSAGLLEALTGNALRRISAERPLGIEEADLLDIQHLRALQPLRMPAGYGSAIEDLTPLMALQPLRLQAGHGSTTEDLAWRVANWGAESPARNPKKELLEGYERYATHNWDGDGAEPVTASTLAYARQIMEQLPDNFGLPEASPGLDGSIVLEWVPEGRSRLHKLFLDIGPGLHWRAYWKMKDGQFDRLLGETANAGQVLQSLFDKLD